MENEKNFPDIKTIVDISDKFGISLDKLLKEDKEMVESITNNVRIAEKWNKYKRTVAMIRGAVIAASVLSAGIYGAVWNIKRTKLENEKLTAEQAKLIEDNSEKIKTALSESIKIYDRAYL